MGAKRQNRVILSQNFHTKSCDYRKIMVVKLVDVKTTKCHLAISRVELFAQGTRKVGRPKITWKRTVVNEAKAAGKQWLEVKALAKNRIRWRQFVDALCSLVE